MSKYGFLKQILINNWHKGVDDNGVYNWTLAEDIKNLSLNEWVCLIGLYCECNDTIAPNQLDIFAKNIIEGREFDNTLNINQEIIIKFLKMLSLSEFRIDDILPHPPQMRDKEFSLIAESIGVDPERLHAVYLNWHTGIRKKIFED